MARAFVFPGQGSQAVGMGRELAEAFAPARHVLEEVDEALKQKLSRLMFEGPEDQLTLTENAQPALMAVSLAVMRTLEREGGVQLADAADFVAGHSLGEYSALAAVPVGEGAMAALLGLDLEDAQAVAEAAAASGSGSAGEVCTTANDNAPGQVVVSGHRAAVERAVALAAERGARRSILLPVSAPFHCPLMAPAADVMAEALAEVVLQPPLVEQVTAVVRWRESVLAMKERGVDTLVEVGAGKVLCGLARRIDRDLSAQPAGTPGDVEALLKTL